MAATDSSTAHMDPLNVTVANQVEISKNSSDHNVAFKSASAPRLGDRQITTELNAGSFPFLDLPGEQRNAVYRLLFDDITESSKAFDVWDPNFPRYEYIPTRIALLQTCWTINYEAYSIFLAEYLPNMIFYFDSLYDFWSFTRNMSSSSVLKTSGAEYMLRSPVVNTEPEHLWQALPLATLAELMTGRTFASELPDEYARTLLECVEDWGYWWFDDPTEKPQVLEESRYGMTFHGSYTGVCEKQSITYFPLSINGPQVTTHFSMGSHTDSRRYQTQTMGGRFCDLDWKQCEEKDQGSALLKLLRTWWQMKGAGDYTGQWAEP